MMDSRQCWKELASTAKCPICSETFKDPKTLPCLHSFCLLCLDNLARIERRGHQDEISCPICQTSIVIPEANTFSDLPTSFHLDRLKEIPSISNENQAAITCQSCNERKTAISYCFDCKDYLCSTCDKAHRRLRITRDHNNILLQNGQLEDLWQRPVMCRQENHEEEALFEYCQQCDECICDICHDEKHQRHVVVDIEQAASEGKKRINEALEKAEEEMIASQDEMKENEDVLKSREQEIFSARQNVKAIVKELIESLKEHEKVVLTKMDDIYEKQQQGHAIKQRRLELFVARLRSPVELGKCVLRRNVDVEIVKEQKAVVDRCEDLLNSKETEALEFPFVDYIIDEEICKTVQFSGPGKLNVSNTDPSQTAASIEGLTDPVVGKKTKILVRTRDSGGKQCYKEDDQVKVKIQSPLEEELETAFEDEKGGKYNVTFTPKVVGQHGVIINVNGHPLTDSPWIVEVIPHQYQKMFELGGKIEDREEGEISSWRSLFYPGRLYSPLDVAISQVNGNIAVLDGCNAIQLYDANGKYLRRFGKRYSEEVLAKRLKFPKSVAFSTSRDIIVIDYTTITLCTEKGIFVRYFMKHIKEPYSVSVASDGRVIVCDHSDALVKVLSPNGEDLLQCFGDPNVKGTPSFAVHHHDKFIVSYCDENRVSVFNLDGTFLYNIGALEHGEEKLNGPLGLAVDKFNNLIVCDSNASRLQVFTLEGRFVTTITGFGSPQFIAVSKDGQLYVVDKEKKCVHVLH